MTFKEHVNSEPGIYLSKEDEKEMGKKEISKRAMVSLAMMEMISNDSDAEHEEKVKKATHKIEKLADELRASLGYEHSLNYLPLIMLFSDAMLGLDGDSLNPLIRELVVENFVEFYKEVPEC